VAFYPTIAIWLCAAVATVAGTSPATPHAWEKTVTPLPRGDFPNPRPLVATYKFGWNNIIAATGEVKFDQQNGRFQLLADGQTVGIARSLWKFDVHHRALADAATLSPITVHQVDITRRKTVTSDLTFKPNRVERVRTDTKSNQTAKAKTFVFQEEIFDLHSVLLRLRSRPFHDGEVYRLVVYPTNSAYLATITVSGRSPVTIATGTYPAIKFDLELNKINRDGELAPHKKFRHATIWVSDNSDRMLLRIEASIFVGTVFAELQSVRFPNDKSLQSSTATPGSGP
jgi:hypothetical protein